MIDTSKFESTFDRFAGCDGKLSMREMASFLRQHDTNKDRTMSECELKSAFQSLGMDDDQAQQAYDNLSESVTSFKISDLKKISTASKIDSDGFRNYLENLLDPPEEEPTAFEAISGGDGLISRSDMTKVLSAADKAGNNDGKINEFEFQDIAKSLGVSEDKMEAVDDLFSEIATNGQASFRDIRANFAEDSSNYGRYSEEAFNNLVKRLSGGDVVEEPVVCPPPPPPPNSCAPSEPVAPPPPPPENSCAPSEPVVPPVVVPDTPPCKDVPFTLTPAQLESLIGKTGAEAEQIVRDLGAREVRVYPEGGVVTMDYVIGRVNIETNGCGNVTKVFVEEPDPKTNS